MSVALCKVNQSSPAQIALYKYLMDNVTELMSNQLKISDVNLLLGASLTAFIHKDESFYQEKFMENAMQCAIDQDASILQAGNLLRNFARVVEPSHIT